MGRDTVMAQWDRMRGLWDEEEMQMLADYLDAVPGEAGAEAVLNAAEKVARELFAASRMPSMMARSIVAPAAMRTSFRTMESRTVAPASTTTPGARTEFTTVPRISLPGDTSALILVADSKMWAGGR